MRLLNVQSLEFTEFYSNPPEYVIASHRWAEGAEVEAIYIDVKEKRNTEKIGYEKVKGFAGYVRRQVPGVKWLWIHTCCINKQDAQEVTEAINSMFKWYRHAEVCLAYLVDVGNSEDIAAFQRSEWFRRGWTLQELLAPRTIVFLTQRCEVIGHKGSSETSKRGVLLETGPALENTITSRTTIPYTLLRNYKQSRDLSIKEKLKWLEDRETTRKEDMSYCLFGIFDVSMPAIYGEGGAKARRRLMSALSSENTIDLGALPFVAEAVCDSFAEREFDTCLEGTRTQLLDQLAKWASDAKGKGIFWLCGKAGTGKPTIARAVAHSFDKIHKCLGATFFFKRGEGDRGSAKRFFPPIAK